MSAKASTEPDRLLQAAENAKKDEDSIGEDERVPFVLCHLPTKNRCALENGLSKIDKC